MFTYNEENTRAADETCAVVAPVCGCVRASKSMLPADEARAWVCSRVRVARARKRVNFNTSACTLFFVRIQNCARIARVIAATATVAASASA